MKRLVVAAVLAGTLLFAGCTAAPADATATDEAAIRALAPEEILGELKYGETQDVDLTVSPKYRAFWFMGERGDQIQATATALDATDPILWLADESFATLTWSNDAKPTDTNSLINNRYLPRTGKYFLVFREVYSAPRAKFAVAVRKLGALPPECDPDGEGTWDAECTEPLDFDPFDPSSCTGPDLEAADAKARFDIEGGFKPTRANVFYRTRQCTVGRTPEARAAECTPWARAFAMDIKLTTILPTPDAKEGAYTIQTEATRKTKIDFVVAPAATANVCIDGPFTAVSLRGDTWTPFADESPGACQPHATAKVTATCARFEIPTIQLSASGSTYYTELLPVLVAKY